MRQNYSKAAYLLFIMTVLLVPAASHAGACTRTTRAAFNGCMSEALDEFWVGHGKCQNEAEAPTRATCIADNADALEEFENECREQRSARRDLCETLGEGPHDPEFVPENFVDPDDIGGSVAANPWLPLIPGRTLVYRSPDERVRVKVTKWIKIIDGVPCRVVRDVVTADGEFVEDTIDWLAQDLDGNVWYCGEVTAEYEDGFPVNTDGSFQAGVDGAKPGLLMLAAPTVGDTYRQEFDLANAEDAATVTDLNGSATSPAASCAGDCLVTLEFTPLSPDVAEDKYYKAGVGNILTIDLESGERTELVKIIDNP